MTTGLAALGMWVVTAASGATLMGTWLARGGVAQHPRGTRLKIGLPPPYFPAPLVFVHFVLAAVGLIVWIVHLLTGSPLLAWIAFSTLLPVAALGFSMFGRWLGSRRLRRVTIASGAALPESRLPTIVVVFHGALGAATIVLTLLAATCIGDG